MPPKRKQPSEISILYAKIDNVCSQLQDFADFLADVPPTNIEQSIMYQIESRVSQIEPVFSQFNEFSTVLKCHGEALNEDDAQRFNRLYFQSIAKAKQLIASWKDSNNLNKQNNVDTNIVKIQESQRKHKLPELKLKEFSGNYLNWLEFKDSFLAMVHNRTSLSDFEKLQYLKMSLSGTALAVVENFSMSAENYSTMWQLLEKRFENKSLLVRAHIQAIFEIPAMNKESHNELRTLQDTLNKNIRALSRLDIPVEHWDAIINHVIYEKFDNVTKKAFSKYKQSIELPSFNDLNEFLTAQCNYLEKFDSNKTVLKPTKESISKKQTQVNISSLKLSCIHCKENHSLYQCPNFLALTAKARFDIATNAKLCKNCLRPNHLTVQYKSTFRCKECHKMHHSLLHLDQSATIPSAEATPTTSISTLANQCSSFETCHEILLTTAVVKIKDSSGHYQTARCLLDSGSQNNFITQELCRKLNLKTVPTNYSIIGINSTTSEVNQRTRIHIGSLHNNFSTELTCLIIPKITDQIPVVSFSVNNLEIPTDLQLADPSFNESSTIDVLIGVTAFYDLLCVGQFKLPNSNAIIQKTKLGWIISGELKYHGKTNHSRFSMHTISQGIDSNIEISEQIKKFWQVDEPLISTSSLSKEEIDCENHFRNNTFQDETGRFVVSLPLKSDPSELGNSETTALNRFKNLELKLAKDSDLNREYCNFMREYEALGHMSKVSICDQDDNVPSFYIPHHPVIKETSLTTKVRVVYDASMKTDNGNSLNNFLMVGPTVQRDLFSILVNFRQYSIVITGDIMQMYRQVLIHPNDRSLQLIFWRESSNDIINTYQLNTVTYGTSSAPYLATKCLTQLSQNFMQQYPKTCEVIANCFYVDDLLTGGDSVDEVKQLREELDTILSSAGFKLRKYLSNSPEVLTSIPNQNVNHTVLLLGENENTKTLGIVFNAMSDVFQFPVKQTSENEKCTKRTILSGISQIFDPLGLLGPIVLVAKLIIQELWKLQITWDESIPQKLHSQWLQLKSQLPQLNTLSIPRHVILSQAHTIEMHAFSDASEKAYGTAIYLRSLDNTASVSVRLLCAKSRVAPLRNITLPRLELSAAVLAVNLAQKVRKSLSCKIDRIYYWSDSAITLQWIHSPSYLRTTFVANRVAEIQNNSSPDDWNYVNSTSNPADLISRGALPTDFIKSTIWFNGPEWLSQNLAHWPEQSLQYKSDSLPETKKIYSVSNVATANNLIATTQSEFIFERFSSITRLTRIIAYCLRLKHNSLTTPENRTSGPLSVHEVQASFETLIKLSQSEAFAGEIDCLLKNKPLNHKSKLLNLNPFLDSKGLLRVGGRLHHSDYEFDKRHPIILDPTHKLTFLILRVEHLRLLHCGVQQLLSSIRDKFWPIHGKNLCKKIVHECVTCFRYKATHQNPIMGNLPSGRVSFVSPFHETGVDYAGPFLLKDRKTRNPKLIKCYIALFICYSTKAIHLELVSELTTEGFLNCLRRFISRRGKPQTINSDNGSNFKGAYSELKELFEFLSNNQTSISQNLSNENITWRFIPPRALHFGGLWESGVKSTKFHLKRIIGNASLNFEEFYTILTQIEAILNSRPLSPLSNDPTDLEPLTPAHFLIGKSLTALPSLDLTELKESRLSKFQRLQQLVQQFWARWKKEYLSELQSRTKWRTNHAQFVKVGALALIREDGSPPQHWRLGRIEQLHPGSDGVVRVVTLKTANGDFKRPVTKICVLPFCE